MDPRKADKVLTIIYSATAVFALVACISSGIVWSHWRLTLNEYCRNDPHRNCSCILYGESYPTHFVGGSLSTCAWIYFGPIPVILGVIAFGIFHGFRACLGTKTEATKSVKTRNEAGETIVLQIRTEDPTPVSRIYYIILSSFSLIFTLYMLGHFATFVDGYLYTCKQYRKELIKMLNLSGTAVAVIHSRISCNAVFDFMDYLQPLSADVVRDNFINTAAGLLSGIICSFFSVVTLISATVINFKFVRNK